MAFDEYNKYEQSELVQKWLRENGLSIVVGVAVGLVGIFGWQQWRNHQANNEYAAAQIYKQMQIAVASGNTNASTVFTDQLLQTYAKSPYAAFAASDRAKLQLQARQPAQAETSLDWAASHTSDGVLKSLVQLRVAQVQLDRGNAKAALTTLDGIPETTYQGLAQELRGDVLVKLGRADDARKAYQTALSALSEEAPQRGALQMKLDDLAVAGKQGA